MVRNRSWPAVSHYNLYQRPKVGVDDQYAYDLKFHGLAIQLDRSYFLARLISHLGFVIKGGSRKRRTKSTPIVEM